MGTELDIRGEVNIDLHNPAHNELIQLIKKTVSQANAPLTNDEFALFIMECNRTQLHPLGRQIYPLKIQGKMTVTPSIDGFRLIAERSGKYAGQTPVQWCGEDGVWKDVWLSSEPPAAAKVGVYRTDFKEPLYAIATWASYAQMNKDGKPNRMWAKMPDLMLSKVAESLALRRAFPYELSGLYTREEMSQAESVDVPAPAPAPVANRRPARKQESITVSDDEFSQVARSENLPIDVDAEVTQIMVDDMAPPSYADTEEERMYAARARKVKAVLKGMKAELADLDLGDINIDRLEQGDVDVIMEKAIASSTSSR